jgi:hypothetical protein
MIVFDENPSRHNFATEEDGVRDGPVGERCFGDRYKSTKIQRKFWPTRIFLAAK